MAEFEQIAGTFSLPASGDLSSYQYHIMSLDTDGKVALAADADSTSAPPFTVLLNDPDAADEAALLALPGSVVKIVCEDTLNEMDFLTCNSSGHAVATTTAGDRVMGIALQAAASGEMVTALLVNFMFEATTE